jgi:hypothetical protein
MSKFKSELRPRLLDDDTIWTLDTALVYESDLLKAVITVPMGFQTDFASVPRVPIVYGFFGDRAHRESVIHDYLYRIDSNPIVSRKQADDVFYEAMKLRGKSFLVRWCMWFGVRLGGWTGFHELMVDAIIIKEEEQ